MGKHILFVVHGIGVHPAQAALGAPAWFDDVKAKLFECADPARYSFFRSKKLEDFVDIVPISYDAEFTQALERWKQAGNGIVAHAKAQGVTDNEVLQFLTKIDPNDPFVYSHLADAVLYRCFPIERQNVRVQVCNQIGQALKARWKDGEPKPKASILAHSLGTAVIHDSLELLATNTQLSKSMPNLLAHPNWGFQTIFMLANTSRALQSDFNAYKSVVRPGPANKKDAYCARYVNFLHEVDPVTLVRRFVPDTWKSLCESVQLDHYRDWNVHGFTHFLDSPKVHTRIFNTVIHNLALSSAEIGNAVDEANYPRFGGKFAPVQVAIAKKNELMTLRDSLPADPELMDYFNAVKRGLAILSDLKNLLP